ncbi:hypothetical protein RUND412_001620 [Rhizina undulata]
MVLKNDRRLCTKEDIKFQKRILGQREGAGRDLVTNFEIGPDAPHKHAYGEGGKLKNLEEEENEETLLLNKIVCAFVRKVI